MYDLKIMKVPVDKIKVVVQYLKDKFPGFSKVTYYKKQMALP